MKELSEMSGIKKQTIYNRMKNLGMDIEQAVDTPLIKPKPPKKIKGKASKHTKKDIKDNEEIISKSLDEIYRSSLIKRPVY